MMHTATPVETIQLHSRQSTAFILLAKLGNKYAWHQLLCRWSVLEYSDEGLAGRHGLTLQPFAKEGREPRYRLADINEFIERARSFDGELGPTKFGTTAFEIDSSRLNPAIHWKNRRVKRCTTSKSEPT